jgi:Acetyltransferase (GNAT) domain
MNTLSSTIGVERVGSFCCYRLDPTHDRRWADLVDRHPRSSVFHTPDWLRALRRTYGYEPTVFTTSPPTGPLRNGLVFCRINSWLTGSRLVSLPFSDHCEPLYDSQEDLDFLIRYLQSTVEQENWRYLEVRQVNGSQSIIPKDALLAATYRLHVLDLRPNLDEVLRRLDKDSVQRRIRHAELAGMSERCGRSEDLLKEFYGLFVITRGRHHLPPAPYAWFRNLVQCLDEALEIRVAYKDETPISAILTLRFRDVVYYKYGCSIARFNRFGAMPWLLWRAIVSGKSMGATEFDMGRTEEENVGLLTFKNHWVPQPRRLVYWRFPDTPSPNTVNGWKLRMAKHVFSSMPDGLRVIAGRLIYPHIG